MTVKELIEELQKIEDKELEVCAIDYEYGENEINAIKVIEPKGANKFVILTDSLV